MESSLVKIWRSNFDRDQHWSTPAHQRIKKKEARKISVLLRSYGIDSVLELGCGDGFLGSQVLLQNNQIRNWTFSDILPESLELARKNSHDPRARFLLLDAAKLKKKNLECIISTGYASVATYREIIPVVAKSLRHEGVLVVDFINHLAIKNLPHIHKNLANFQSGKSYHFSFKGIEQKFKNEDLQLVKYIYIDYPWQNPFLAVFRKI